MANKRTISWNTAMRDLRNDRMRRAGVHEERLRATAGLRSSSTLSSWRGHSGRRYIVGVHPLALSELLDVTDALLPAGRPGAALAHLRGVAGAALLAGGRDGAGAAHVADVAMAGAQPSHETRTRWMAKVQ